MHNMKLLAPTIFDALQAVELGCRKIQDDHEFRIDMAEWLFVSEEWCCGCLATATLMQLTNKTAKDIINTIPEDGPHHETSVFDRSLAFDIELEDVYNSRKLMCQFENAINLLRQRDLSALLEFYQLNNHENAAEASKWLFAQYEYLLDTNAKKADLLLYADFLRDDVIPKMKNWFA